MLNKTFSVKVEDTDENKEAILLRVYGGNSRRFMTINASSLSINLSPKIGDIMHGVELKWENNKLILRKQELRRSKRPASEVDLSMEQKTKKPHTPRK